MKHSNRRAAARTTLETRVALKSGPIFRESEKSTCIESRSSKSSDEDEEIMIRSKRRGRRRIIERKTKRRRKRRRLKEEEEEEEKIQVNSIHVASRKNRLFCCQDTNLRSSESKRSKSVKKMSSQTRNLASNLLLLLSLMLIKFEGKSLAKGLKVFSNLANQHVVFCEEIWSVWVKIIDVLFYRAVRGEDWMISIIISASLYFQPTSFMLQHSRLRRRHWAATRTTLFVGGKCGRVNNLSQSLHFISIGWKCLNWRVAETEAQAGSLDAEFGRRSMESTSGQSVRERESGFKFGLPLETTRKAARNKRAAARGNEVSTVSCWLAAFSRCWSSGRQTRASSRCLSFISNLEPGQHSNDQPRQRERK